jgi:hypothetical protein
VWRRVFSGALTWQPDEFLGLRTGFRSALPALLFSFYALIAKVRQADERTESAPVLRFTDAVPDDDPRAGGSFDAVPSFLLYAMMIGDAK